MNQQHDWLAKVGENYIAYLFSRDSRFEVFGSGMWDADCAVHDIETDKWLRIEVKTSNTKQSLKQIRGPAKNRLKKQINKYDLVCFVSVVENKIKVELYKKDSSKIENPTIEQLKNFIINK